MQPVLTIENLSLSRTNKQGFKHILNACSFGLNTNELVRIAGPSGCGKSSLLLALAQLIPIDGGALRVRGVEYITITPQQWRTRVALVMQTPIMINGTVRDNINLPLRLSRAQRERLSSSFQHIDEHIRREMDSVGLADIALDTDAAQISVGQKARVALIRTLLTRPDCLLVDEPYAALDDDSRALVTSRLQSYANEGNAVLMVHHGKLEYEVSYTLQLKELALLRVSP